MKIGGILKQSYNMLFKNRTLLLLGIIGAVISSAAGFLFRMLFSGNAQTNLYQTISYPGLLYAIGVIAEAIIAAIIIGLAGVFIIAAIISAASSGSEAELGASIRKASSRYISLLGACIASGALIFLAFLPGLACMLLAVVLNGIAAIIALIIGFVLFIIPGMYMSLRLSLTSVACVAGGKRAIESVKNSWSITKGNLWAIFAIQLVLGLIAGFVGIAITLSGVVAYTTDISSLVGSFVEALLAYSITIALVLVYQQLTGHAAKKASARKK